MFQKEITKEEINTLDVRQFEGDIRVVDDAASFRDAMDELRKYKVLGFDTETKPAFKKGVNHRIALVQVSNSHVAWLFRVNKIGMPAELRHFLEDEGTLKVGAGLLDDMRRLRQIMKFSPGGFLDLQKYVEAFSIESKSLKKMVAIVLGYKISKSQQMSNWEADELTPQQQKYAATDAWACLEIYNKLRNALNEYYG
ncbi:MAG: 3'-5' exonuclease domain-containing protein 2 [Bacteroidales bacterium]|nr:3'-5' exonuclease domain-containing protein 2 [Bacteroidales bacterium]MDT8432538.1 3'-5' exonuclease [Bacteroidales bacterium]